MILLVHMQDYYDYSDWDLEDDGESYEEEELRVPTPPVLQHDDGLDDITAAEEATARALQLANQGLLQDALPSFYEATKRHPAKDTYWSNLGVTQMRIGLLDEALVSYTRALKLNPSSSLVEENIAALRGKVAATLLPGPCPRPPY